MKWYEKLLKVVKYVFEFIGKGIKALFKCFDSLDKWLLACYIFVIWYIQVKNHVHISEIFLSCLSIIMIVKLAFDIREEK